MMREWGSCDSHLEIVFPWHVLVGMGFASAVDGLSLGRRSQIIIALSSGSLPVLHLVDGEGKGIDRGISKLHQNERVEEHESEP